MAEALIKIPENQKLWLNKNFCLKKECYTKFTNEAYFLNFLNGFLTYENNRFVDYLTLNLEFHEYKKEVKNQYTKIITQLLYLKKQAEEKEFYELLKNINLMLNLFAIVVEISNDKYAAEIVNKNSVQLGIKNLSL